jgi:phosphoserine phosphatase
MTIRLVVFDVDGTLTIHSSIWWRLHEQFGTEAEGRVYHSQYFSGEITYQQWADYDAALWRNQPLQEVIEIAQATQLRPGAEETIATLQSNGIHVALLSSGLDILANNVGERLGIDHIITNRLIHKDGLLTGEVEIRVGWHEKALELEKLCDFFKVSLDETAFVGDGRNDISALKLAGLSIAYKPRYDDVSESAMVTVFSDDLREVLSHIL